MELSKVMLRLNPRLALHKWLQSLKAIAGVHILTQILR
ncbi:hypothetical protein Syncc8109_0602 [Synechococcus sp. WH 8109]|nr:hypothetical protein Syncc8109_0602 [Synechococcus sp. WH 8109]